VLDGAGTRRRITAGVATGLGLLAPGLFWMSEFSAPGYVLAVLIEVTLLTICVVAVPPGRGRLLGLPAALLLAEALRGIWPFGGVPIATIAQTQIGGPLSQAARAGGGLLVAAAVAAAGVALWALARRRLRPAAVGAALAVPPSSPARWPATVGRWGPSTWPSSRAAASVACSPPTPGTPRSSPPTSRPAGSCPQASTSWCGRRTS
jgi:apolipoprotein N-acyltransferase